jgi:serine/threonine protein kinase
VPRKAHHTGAGGRAHEGFRATWTRCYRLSRMSVNARTFGPYILVRRIGAGGMAETFEAVRTGPGGFEQRVCVKRILPEVSDDPNFVRLFREEARVAARLRHANIVQLLDVGLVDDAHYLTLELVEGCDLRRLLQSERARQGCPPGAPGGGLTSGIVAFLAAELATALEVAHGGATAIVHRDISPSNVLLSTAGEVKLADFGIARAITDNQATRTHAIRGKVPYMAPEYALRGVVDRRVDLFALGVLLYEALAGVRPFDGRSDVETLSHLEQGLHTPLAERCPGAPTQLVEAIEQLILPDPEARTPSATALLDALVDVAPPPTARRILGELVTQAARGRAAVPKPRDAIDPLAATSHAATPTHVATDATDASAPSITTPDAMPPRSAPTTTDSREAIHASRTMNIPSGHFLATHTVALTDAAPLPAQAPARPYAVAAPDAPTRTAMSAVHDPATATFTQAGVDALDAIPTTIDASRRDADGAAAPTAASSNAVAGGAAAAHAISAPPPADRTAAPARGTTRGRVLLAALALGGVTLALVTLRPRTQPDVTSSSPPRGTDALPRVRADAPPTSPLEASTLPTIPPAAAEAPMAAASPARPSAPPSRVDAPPASARVDDEAPARQAQRERAAATRSNSRDPRSTPPGSPRESTAFDETGDPSSRALLTIVSDPGHPIFVDGHHVGDGPRTVPLAPGRHVLRAGQGADAPTLAVDLARGERRRIVLR